MGFRDLVHTPPAAPASLVLPESLRAKIDETHGAAAQFELPADYAAFLRETGGGFHDPRPNEWWIYTWDTAVAKTEHVYDFLYGDAPEEEIIAARESMRRVGVWLQVGTYWRVDHYLCCDRSKPEFGAVYGVNDGDPGTGLVYDSRYESFDAYLR